MPLLIFALIVVIVLILAIFGVDMLVSALGVDARLGLALKVILIVIAILVICQRAGLV